MRTPPPAAIVPARPGPCAPATYAMIRAFTSMASTPAPAGATGYAGWGRMP
jgi:hypothetical protein